MWAFLDKLLALGSRTGYDQEGNLYRFGDAARINGGSPTEGFPSFGVNPDSPFAGFFTSLARYAIVDWAFMVGLLGIGLALTWASDAAGSDPRRGDVPHEIRPIMLPENNPVFDDPHRG